MNDKLMIESKTLINAPTFEVWNVLTNPEKTKQYMFGCEVLTNWQIDSPLEWVGASDKVKYVSGYLLELQKEHKLVYTTYPPNAHYPNERKNHLVVTCTLAHQDGGTLLTISQGDYNTVAEGKQRYDDTMAGGGWDGVLKNIKKIAEVKNS